MSELGRAMWAPVRHATLLDPHKLPACMCGILKRAVEDAMAVEEMPGYRLNMGEWHSPNGTCRVCLAGAVMVRTLQVDRQYVCEPTDFDKKTELILYAVNSMRVGCFTAAYGQIYGIRTKPTREQAEAMMKADRMIEANYGRRHAGRAEWGTYLEAVKVLEAVGL